MVIDESERFHDCLHGAEEQLHWGTDPESLDQAAAALARIDPGNVVVEQLAQRAAILRAARRALARCRATRPPMRIRQQARLLSGRA